VNRYLCIHGHFYQPPRENPWLEEVEIQDSAYPYHDWNQRITIECYAPNGASRILNKEDKITNIVNNYAKISFNFGPTLLSWMEKNRPKNYQAILNADKQSMENFGGHGSALGQVYNHMIMPLANSRDKLTQILWGIKDFEHRFHRRPEGMWLAETAVDFETLDILAEQGIKFTILSPYQARSFRKKGTEEWKDATGGKIDPKKSYICNLPSGKQINIFFYDGPVSQDIAFGGLLNSGENFANRLVGTFDKNSQESQLVNIATDGETYGHHHSYGEMALSYCYSHIVDNNLAKITIYGQYLEKCSPEHEVQIIEDSSWSCFHGVQRWHTDCGCNVNTNSSWNQKWRTPLRQAMDWLRDNISGIYEEKISKFVDDPWKARNDYIDIILNRSQDSINAFISNNAQKQLSDDEKVDLLRLLEMQRHAMLMYTSCGWFFDELSGIETVQVIHYAARAIQLAKQVSGIDLEAHYLDILKQAKSNIADYEDGAKIYNMWVKPTMLDLKRVAAHYAVDCLFTNFENPADIYCYQIDQKTYQRMQAGKQQLAIGSITVTSQITYEKEDFSFAVLHLGDHIVFGGINKVLDDDLYLEVKGKIADAFQKSDVSEIISLLDQYFGSHDFSLWHLFRDDQRRVLDSILNSTLNEIETSFRQIKENHYPIMLAMKEIGTPLPKVFLNTFEFIFNTDIKKSLESEQVEVKKLVELVKQAKLWSLNIDKQTIGFVASKKITALMEQFNNNPDNIIMIKTMENIFKVLRPLDLPLRIWEAQNIYFAIKKELFDIMQAKAKKNDKNAKRWCVNFNSLGNILSIRSK
jgi:alpha-amylase/alpha-mannosidase (GH57 family)